MDFRDYAKGIKFRYVGPMDEAWLLEAMNTVAPDDSAPPMAELLSMPRMSTGTIGLLINKAVREMPEGQCFVNIGVWAGFSLLAGMLGNPDKQCIGVDNFSEFGGPRAEFRKRFMEAKSENHSFFDMDYKWYFSNFHKNKLIGFYFYDGAHDYQNQIDGLKIAEPFLADGAIVMVDDTNWPDPDKAARDFMASSPFNWEIILDEKTSGNGHPTFWNGLLIIKKLGSKDNATEKGQE